MHVNLTIQFTNIAFKEKLQDFEYSDTQKRSELIGEAVSGGQSENRFVVSRIHGKHSRVTGSGLEGTPKLLKTFFSRLFLCQNFDSRNSRFHVGQFFVH